MANTEETKSLVKFYRGQFGENFDNFGTPQHTDTVYDPSGIYFNYDTKTIYQSGVEYGVRTADFDALKTKLDNKTVTSATLAFNGTELSLGITLSDNSVIPATLNVEATNVKFTPITGTTTKTAITGATVQAAFDSVASSLKTNEKAVADEKTRAEGVEKVLSDDIVAIKGDGYATADYKDIASLSNKVKTLEGVEYTGENAIKVTDKKIALTIAEGEKILSQSANGLLSTLSLDYSDQKIKLVGKAGELVSEISASEFTKDGFLDNVVLDEDNNLVFTWNAAAGKTELKVNIGDYIDNYTAGDGLALTGKEFSVKKDATSEGFLTVGTGGVKLSGVQDAIDAAVATEKTRAEKAEKENKDAIGILNGSATTTGSVAKAVKDAVAALDSTATSTGANNNVTVTVKLVDGKLTADGVTVVDNTQEKFNAIDAKFDSMTWIDCGTYEVGN